MHTETRKFLKRADRLAEAFLEDSGPYAMFNGNTEPFDDCIAELSKNPGGPSLGVLQTQLKEAIGGAGPGWDVYSKIEDYVNFREWERVKAAYVIGLAIGRCRAIGGGR